MNTTESPSRWVPFKVMATGIALGFTTSLAAFYSAPPATEERAIAGGHMALESMFVFWNALFLVPVFWIILAAVAVMMHLAKKYRLPVYGILIILSVAAFILVSARTAEDALLVHWGAICFGITMVIECFLTINKKRKFIDSSKPL